MITKRPSLSRERIITWGLDVLTQFTPKLTCWAFIYVCGQEHVRSTVGWGTLVPSGLSYASVMDNIKGYMVKTSCPWSHGLRPEKLLVSVAMAPAPVRIPSERPLAPSVASVTSVANDKW
jgi:hypothetical protein